MREWSSGKVSVTVSKFNAYYPHITGCFHLKIYAVFSMTNVNVTSHWHNFTGSISMVRYLLRAKHIILSLCSINPAMCLFFVIVHPCIPRAGFEAIFDFHFSIIQCSLCLHIVESTSCNKSWKRLGFIIFVLTSTSHFYAFKCFHFVALILSLKRRFRISSHVINSQ